MRFRTTGVLFLLVMMMAAAADAQVRRRATTPRHTLTVFGGLSLSDVQSDDGDRLLRTWPLGRNQLVIPPGPQNIASLDGSAELGVRYGYAVTDMVTVEGDFSVAPSHTLDQLIVFGCPPEVLCIARPEIELFVPDIRRSQQLAAYHYGGGIRLALTRGPVRPSVIGGIGGVTWDGEDLRQTDLALRLGGAVEAVTGPVLTSIEVVDVIVADHFVTGRAEHDVHVRFGLGVRW